MGKLGERVKEISPYIKLGDGKEIIGVYKGWKEIADSFNPEKTKFRYSIEVNGNLKSWDNGSMKIATVFDNCMIGDKVKIMAKGEGKDRKYDVVKVLEELPDK